MLQSQNEFTEFDMDTYLERDVSPQALIVLAKIGSQWNTFVGSTGSYVNNSAIINALNETEPWSANKITGRRQGGANGVKWSLIPLLLENNIATIVEGKKFTRYQLTDIGREVLTAMVINCSHCENTRTCVGCAGTGRYTPYRDTDTRNRPVYCRTGQYNSNIENYDIPTKEHIDSCNSCDSEGYQKCYTCSGNKKCNQCVSAIKFLGL